MKKFVAFLICAVLISSLIISFTACSVKDTGYAIHDSLISDNYVDYAKEVKLNTETYPQIADQGLFLVSGYDAEGKAVEIAADDANNIKNNFDATLPSIILVHGVKLRQGRYGNTYFMSENQGESKELGNIFRSGENAKGQKWNLFYFHYEKFADAEGDDQMASLNPTDTERRVWMRGTDGEGNQFCNPDGSYSGQDALAYSLAEFFAAEYIRTMNAVNAEFPNYATSGNEIRTASHSMGGALTVATVSLLNILSHDGQLNSGLLPDRMALLDSYVGGGSDTSYKIAWSNKNYINNSPRSNYYYSLENIVKDANIAVEFYYNQDAWVPFTGMLNLDENEQTKNLVYFKEISKLAPMLLLYPDFTNVNGVSFDGHDAIMEWYFTSYKSAEIKYYDKGDFVANTEETEMGALKDNAVSIGIAPSATTSAEQIRNLRGVSLEMKKTWSYNDCASIECDDDVIVNK